MAYIVKKANELDFISLIKRDGSGVGEVKEGIRNSDDEYNLYRLSITEDTYIAINMSAFVVRIKKQ
jgi:hypothetical protein